MVVYKDSDGNALSMEEALTRVHFFVEWLDAIAECKRPRFDETWSVTRTVNGMTAGYGKVTRSNHAFFRTGSKNAYNTFDEAARQILEPIGQK